MPPGKLNVKDAPFFAYGEIFAISGWSSGGTALFLDSAHPDFDKTLRLAPGHLLSLHRLGNPEIPPQQLRIKSVQQTGWLILDAPIQVKGIEELVVRPNDGPAIQAALDHAGRLPQGAVVYISAGSYLIGATGARNNRPLFVWSNTWIEGQVGPAYPGGPPQLLTRLRLANNVRQPTRPGAASAMAIFTNSRSLAWANNQPGLMHEFVGQLPAPTKVPPPNRNLRFESLVLDGNKAGQDLGALDPRTGELGDGYRIRAYSAAPTNLPEKPIYIAGGDPELWRRILVRPDPGPEPEPPLSPDPAAHPGGDERDIGLAAALALFASDDAYSARKTIGFKVTHHPGDPPATTYLAAIYLEDGDGRISPAVRVLGGFAAGPRSQVALQIGRNPTRGLSSPIRAHVYVRTVLRGDGGEPGQVPSYRYFGSALLSGAPSKEEQEVPGSIDHEVIRLVPEPLVAVPRPVPGGPMVEALPDQWVGPPGLGVTHWGNAGPALLGLDYVEDIEIVDLEIHDGIDGVALGSNGGTISVAQSQAQGKIVWETVGSVTTAALTNVVIRDCARWGVAIAGPIRSKVAFTNVDLFRNALGGVDVEIAVGTDANNQWDVGELSFKHCLLIGGGPGIKFSGNRGSTNGPLKLDGCFLVGQDVPVWLVTALGDAGPLPIFLTTEIRGCFILYCHEQAVRVEIPASIGLIDGTLFDSCGLTKWQRPFYAFQPNGTNVPVLSFADNGGAGGKWTVSNNDFFMDLWKPYWPGGLLYNAQGVVRAHPRGPLVDLRGNRIVGRSFKPVPGGFEPAPVVFVNTYEFKRQNLFPNTIQRTSQDFVRDGDSLVRPGVDVFVPPTEPP